ncbi:ABC transporter permease subunit [Citrobacter sp. RHBSTW-01065]|nr:ABC transporter permease subunit [Citrobacter sp. RHBSTW-01065]
MAGVDMLLMRVTIFISFPLSLCTALTLSRGALGRGWSAMCHYFNRAPIARLARAGSSSRCVRGRFFISAVRLRGHRQDLWRHIVPLCLPSVIIRITMNMARIILTAAGLGFLGLGAQPPDRIGDDLQRAHHDGMLVRVVTIPGLAILISSLAFNFLGDGLRDILDPRSE